MSGFVELGCMSNFSFQQGASHADEFLDRAAELGMTALGICDIDTVSGLVRALEASRRGGVRLVAGSRLRFDAPVPGAMPVELMLWPFEMAGWANLCRLITDGHRRGERALGTLQVRGGGCMAAVVPPPGVALAEQWFLETVEGLARVFDDRLSLALCRHGLPDEGLRLRQMLALCEHVGVPPLATNLPRYHHASRRELADVLTAVRVGRPVEACGEALTPNHEAHLRGERVMRALFDRVPQALDRSVQVAERCRGFSLEQVRWRYPLDVAPVGVSPIVHLRELVWKGAAERWPGGVPPEVASRLQHELTLIEELRYEPYFLTVHEIVAFARSQGILCQGRGAAANSAVCFCLGITAVDPGRMDMLFERFISRERDEPPDIDVDFEHERREEVIQWIYRRWGRHHAALTAEVIRWRGRSAVRDVGKALGLSRDATDRLAKRIDRHMTDPRDGEPERTEVASVPPQNDLEARVLRMAAELEGFPRHLSQHVGGFVMSHARLDEIVPVRPATMADRTIIEWDKDDLETMGLLKVDVLALGMLTCIRKCLQLVNQARPEPAAAPLAFHAIPSEDPDTYDMLCRADTVGVFQVESRAQMSMLPRLKPRRFYDLVVQVAIVRPGPIQGDMVHPYLRRRAGLEPVTYPDARIERVLGRTLGVPLFQEQAMSLAVVAAGFTPGQADQLRRSIAAWKRRGNQLAQYGERLEAGMVANGYTRQFAQQVFTQIQGFSGYGFPESHAASFALLAYASAWLKRHHPAAFTAALLNSQPMGFYAPAQLVRDARDHGVEVRPVDANFSAWPCTLEPRGTRGFADPPALRLGLCMVRGLSQACGERVAAVRGAGPWRSLEALWRASGARAAAMRALARADAFGSMGLAREQALWQAGRLREVEAPLFEQLPPDAGRVASRADLPPIDPLLRTAADYRGTGLSLRGHPMRAMRGMLSRRGVRPCASLRQVHECPDGSMVSVAGMVLLRQKPGTAKGTVFITLEDESGAVNLIVRPKVWKRDRAGVRHEPALIARGRVQHRDGVVHLLATRLRGIDRPLDAGGQRVREFR
jgi:error-prone DNA polymerase